MTDRAVQYNGRNHAAVFDAFDTEAHGSLSRDDVAMRQIVWDMFGVTPGQWLTRHADATVTVNDEEPQEARVNATPNPERPTIRIRMIDGDLPVPKFAHVGDAGADLVTREGGKILPGQRLSVPTGVAIELPIGTAAFVHPRSGLALRDGITVLNSPGTIDSAYRGEICVILHNTDAFKPFRFSRGDRIAQLVVQQVLSPEFEVVEGLSDTARGTGGFGSTGVSGVATRPGSGQAFRAAMSTVTTDARPGAGQTFAAAAARGESG
ncbi:MAG TPA: dUTP diphosphatase [Demequina sp.]|nr:dUTP diphosphatase [Demequina sp.]